MIPIVGGEGAGGEEREKKSSEGMSTRGGSG